MTVSLFPVVTHYWYVWCDDHSGCIFNIAVCKTERKPWLNRSTGQCNAKTGLTPSRRRLFDHDYHQNH